MKPANLLLNEKWQLVLADFGTAKVLNELETGNPLGLKKSISENLLQAKSTILVEAVDKEEIVGTEAYISPESIETCSGKL